MHYNHTTKTLTLNGMEIEASLEDDILDLNVDGLTIKLVGDNAIQSSGSGIAFYASATISGSSSSKLIATGGTLGLYSNSCDLTIEGGCTVEASGNWGIAGGDGSEVLTIKNSMVRATGAEEGSIVDFQNLVLDGCAITAPEGAAFDASLKGVVLNGETVKEQVVIEPAPTPDPEDPSTPVESVLLSKVQASPNPFGAVLELSGVENAVRVEVYSPLGQLVYSQLLSGAPTLRVETAGWQSGLYLVKLVDNEDGNRVIRVVKR